MNLPLIELTEITPQMTSNSKKRIMVIDDSLTVRKVILKSFESSTAEVKECASAKAGLEELNRTYYDLIFLDYMLPDSTASEFLEALLVNMHYTEVPVVLMSSKGAEIERLSKFQENVIKTLTKPFTRDAVLETAESAFGLGNFESLSRTTGRSQQNSKANPSQLQIVLEKGLKRATPHIPALEAKRGNANPRDYYLPFLLHPELIKSLDRTNLSDESANEAKHPDKTGHFDSESTFELLHFLSEGNKTGRLELLGSEIRAEIHLHKGMVVGIGTKNANSYLASLPIDPSDFDEKLLLRAKNLQEEDGKPALLQDPALFGSGADLFTMLVEGSETFLSRLFISECQFKFWEDEIAPSWAIDNSLNCDVADFVLRSLRRIHGWGLVSREIGDLVNRFGHRYKAQKKWHIPFLTSFEVVVYDFLQFEYSVTELASTLGEAPSRVSDTIHTLYRFGLLEKIGKPEPLSTRNMISEKIGVLALTTDHSLISILENQSSKEDLDIQFSTCEKDAILAAEKGDIAIVIDGGAIMPKETSGLIQKLRTRDEELIVIVADPRGEDSDFEEIIRMKPDEYKKAPFRVREFDKLLGRVIEKLRSRTHPINTDPNELESINKRLQAREAKLDAVERELQKRENQLLHNEELFFEHCNRFEEERARLEILQENF
ncbi:MAG: response regulator [Verrucomicrobiota bacterium]